MTKKEIKINLEKPITFHPQLAKVLGGVEEAIFVQQLYYWTDKCEDKEGWVYKSKKEWEKETTLSRKIQDRIRKKLVETRVIEVKKKKANGAPTLWYKLDIDRVNELLRANEKDPKGLMEKSQRGQWKSPNGTNPYMYAENTTENTTENNNMQSKALQVSDDEIQRIAYKKQIDHLIALFKEVNPTYERLFGNKTQRAAMERLLKKLGPEKLEKIIKFLPRVIGKPFAPVITTPYLLEQKLANLIVYIQQNKGRSNILKI